MNIEVRLFAYLRDLNPEFNNGAVIVELNTGDTVAGLISQLKTYEEDTLIIMVNGNRESKQWKLTEGDKVNIFPLVDGG